MKLKMQRRFLSSVSAGYNTLNHRRWCVKQVKKSNFQETIDEIRTSIDSSDFVAVSLLNTGSYAAAWHRVSAVDMPHTAYLKARYAAERYQTLHLALCPFSLRGSKLTVHPYNFHLFPRDELKLGMPSYSFSCQPSRLTAMAKEGFDFNTCIYEGISYLSRAQESASKFPSGNPVLADPVSELSSPASVADTIFVERIRSRVKNWKQSWIDSNSNITEPLLLAINKIVLGSERYASRPCMTIDVCSERQVQLILQMLTEFADDIVPLLVPGKGGGTQAVYAVLTTSKEDMDLLKKEIREQNRRVRGFREVIDLISASQKPVVSLNPLKDFTFIHSKFLAPLPLSVDEFTSSLSSAFPNVVDLNRLMKKVSPSQNITNIASAMSYMNRFLASMDVEVANQGSSDKLAEGHQLHGQNAVQISQVFAKLCVVLKTDPVAIQSNDNFRVLGSDEYANSHDSCTSNPSQENVRIWSRNSRSVSSENLVFLWGLGKHMTAAMLKNVLQQAHMVFREEFDVKFIDKSCAIVVFWKLGSAETFLKATTDEEQLSGSLKEMVAEGLRVAGYDAYKRACRLGLWEADLADSLDLALEYADIESDSNTKSSEDNWTSEFTINFDDL